jgi:serine/threonine-protein kinase RsbW
MRETATAPLLAWSRVFPAVPAQVREARQFLSAILDGRPATDDSILCLSELVTNATVHSRSSEPDGHFSVRVHLDGGCLRVEVSDQGGPWAQPAQTDERNGRGLLIVDQLARAWGRTGNDKAGGRSGTRSSACERRPGHRLGPARHVMGQADLAAYLCTRRSPAAAVASPAWPDTRGSG